MKTNSSEVFVMGHIPIGKDFLEGHADSRYLERIVFGWTKFYTSSRFIHIVHSVVLSTSLSKSQKEVTIMCMHHL